MRSRQASQESSSPSPEPLTLAPSSVLDRRRVLILDVSPQVDGGQFPVKRCLGDRVDVEVDLVADGHDRIAGAVLYRRIPQPFQTAQEAEPTAWRRSPLTLLDNSRYGGSFVVSELGLWQFTIEAWVDAFASWLSGFERKVLAQCDPGELSVELQHAAALVGEARGAHGADAVELQRFAVALVGELPVAMRSRAASEPELLRLMSEYPCQSHAVRDERQLEVRVDRELARCSAWYELFPRSCGTNGEHGTFADVERMLPYVADMGFDVLYLPPIHPIGSSFRKGRNNSTRAEPGEPGSPWAIGSEQGGHEAIHPELGTLADFDQLVKSAQASGIEIALDIAFQASPEHPYVKAHPEWFAHRADGSIRYAENPPKKYQDIYPFELSGPGADSLWRELRDVFLVWIERGVRVFRVDNPHTKPLRFWQWCIADLKSKYPDLIFLAEAFTHPKLTYALAKVGFSQSYTYFTWRESAQQLREYLLELAAPPVSEFFRPNFWPNTPDILPAHLQGGERAMFAARAILAATLCSNYGIYGPAFELMEHTPIRPGAEEYGESEKYQLRSWDLGRADSLSPLLGRLNRIRKENPALQRTSGITFHDSTNPQFLAYSKADPSVTNVVLVVVNLDPHHEQSGFLELERAALGQPGEAAIEVHDLLSDERFTWPESRAFIRLDPRRASAHVFVVQTRPTPRA
ncbi:MAG: alpha-1,4-glucan--maltose-1-phosphate maltosyltransferase [Polyangiaceae bacterium]